MSLSNALQIGRSALSASQLAIQVAGNNVANAATRGYSRQDVAMRSISDSRTGGNFIGRGVEVQTIRRQVDAALQQRLLGGVSAEAAATSDLQQLSSVEATLNELDNRGLSSQIGAFFNSWSALANTPGDPASRMLVVQQGRTLAGFVRTIRSDLETQRTAIDRDLQSLATRVDSLLGEIAGANQSIVLAEGGSGQANGLRDRRDALITELSQYVDVTTVEQPSGSLDVLVGSSPVVLAGTSRGLQFSTEAAGDKTIVKISTRDNAEQLTIRAGRIGSLLQQRGTLVDSTLESLDRITGQLIHQVNRAHSQGVGGQPYTSLTGDLSFAPGDVALALNDPLNTTTSRLAIKPQSGSFSVRIRDEITGDMRTATIRIDLDGLIAGANPTPGTSTDTSLQDIANQISAIPNMSATITPNGQLKIEAAAGFSVSFGDDTSGVLATAGVNTYFTGTDASNIAVRASLVATPSLLATGNFVARNTPGSLPGEVTSFEGDRNDNGIALLISGIRSKPIDALGNNTIDASWNETVQSIAVRAAAASTAADSATTVRESLDSQRSAIAGVSMDEEAINLLQYQRQYQASARYISVVDDLTQTLLGLIR